MDVMQKLLLTTFLSLVFLSRFDSHAQLVTVPSPRTHAQAGIFADSSATMSDRDKAGLRGPVKECIEEATYNEFSTSTKTDYSADGNLLTQRTVNHDGSDWLQTWIYDSLGRLTKYTFGKSGDKPREITYEYDGSGRLLTIKNPDSREETRFQYDERGHKTSVKTFNPEKSEDTKAVGGDVSALAAAEFGYGVPRGGTLSTIFDKNDRPAELLIRDASGSLVSRVVRIYGANGQLLEEKSTMENPVLLLFADHPELLGQLDPSQLAAVNKGLTTFMRGQGLFGKRYSYDSGQRVREVHTRSFAFDQTTTTMYNEEGDISETREISTMNPYVPAGRVFSIDDDGNLVPENKEGTPVASPAPPRESKANYIYEYDSYSSWTKQTTIRPGSPPTVRARTITYY